MFKTGLKRYVKIAIDCSWKYRNLSVFLDVSGEATLDGSLGIPELGGSGSGYIGVGAFIYRSDKKKGFYEKVFNCFDYNYFFFLFRI